MWVCGSAPVQPARSPGIPKRGRGWGGEERKEWGREGAGIGVAAAKETEKCFLFILKQYTDLKFFKFKCKVYSINMHLGRQFRGSRCGEGGELGWGEGRWGGGSANGTSVSLSSVAPLMKSPFSASLLLTWLF